MATPASPTKINTQFSAQDADITIQSSDGVLFKLHRQNLGTNTGGFPGMEISTQEEIVHLPEPAKVLEIVFQFVYPKKHPKLKGLDFGTILEVAEAVEKYEVFAAMNICEIRLHEFPPDRAANVFVHAIKHEYPELINKTAVLFCRYPALDLIKGLGLPAHCIIPWLQYQAAWQEIFDNVTQYIERLKADTQCTFATLKKGNSIRNICGICRMSLLCHVTRLSRIETLSSLNEALESPRLLVDKIDKYSWCDSCTSTTATCGVYAPIIRNTLQAAVAAIPPFTHFLKVNTAGRPK